MQKHKLQDYKIIKKIGSGSFGQIMLVELMVDGKPQQFAMKKISQNQLLKVNKMHEPFIERQILFRFKEIAPQGFVGIYETHSDKQYIYMILEYCEGGDLQGLIMDMHKIENKNEVIKRIIAKIVLTLEVMKENKVLHRDLKPSNFLFHQNGTMRLADFGTAYTTEQFLGKEAGQKIAMYKKISEDKKKQKSNEQEPEFLQIGQNKMRRATFVGTTFYMPPQLLSQDYYSFESQLWPLGCITYEAIHSKTPFEDENEGLVWKRILNDDLSKVKIDEIIPHSRDFILSLLKRQKQARLGFGTNGFQNIKNHPFFENIDWQNEKQRQIKEIKDYFLTRETQSLEKTMNKEKIIYSGVVQKKMFFGNFKDRSLVLTSVPKIIYYDTESGEKKGEILLSEKTPIALDGKNFSVTTEKKTYYYKSGKAEEWVQMLNYAIVNKFY